MAFIEQEAKAEYKIINGKRTLVITPECEITLKNLETGQEYNSDKEADDDVDNPDTSTKINLIPHNSIEYKISNVISNSFGFGGTNASLIFGN